VAHRADRARWLAAAERSDVRRPRRELRLGWGASSRKLAGPAIRAAELGRIDAVLLSHDDHADNLDDAGRTLLPAAGAVVTTAPGAERLGGNARGLTPWQSTRLEVPGRPPLEITATPCRHGPPLSRPLTGDAIGFAVHGGALWISGDTAIPVHYEGWAHFREDRATAERELAAAPQEVRWLPIGEPVEL